MKTILFIVLLIVANVFAIHTSRRIIDGIGNLVVVFKRRRHTDFPVQSNGIVFNKKTGKLEADQTYVMPF